MVIVPAILVDCTMTCARPLKSDRLRLLVALVAVGIAVADADQRALAGDFEVDQVLRRRQRAARRVERVDGEHDNVGTIGVDRRPVRQSNAAATISPVVSRFSVSTSFPSFHPCASIAPAS